MRPVHIYQLGINIINPNTKSGFGYQTKDVCELLFLQKHLTVIER